MSETPIKCPRCTKDLVLKNIPEKGLLIETDYCQACKGTWFDKGELEKIEQIIEPVFYEIRRIPSEEKQNSVLNCPKCTTKTSLEKHRHPRDKFVIIDVCPSCKGIWLDGGELEAIQKENVFTAFSRVMRNMS